MMWVERSFSTGSCLRLLLAILARSIKATMEGFLKYKTESNVYFPHGLGKSFGAILVILDHDFSFSMLLFIFLPYH